MTIDEAIEAYIERFGGFPFMSLRGVPDETVIELVQTALETGEEIAINYDDSINPDDPFFF